jgi:hypothetical protein
VSRDVVSFGQAPVGTAVDDTSAHPLATRRSARASAFATALPLSVWREHVKPVLSAAEAKRLRLVSQALKAIVRGWPMLLKRNGMGEGDLQAALTCFPANESLTINIKKPLSRVEELRLVEVLWCGGRVGR